MGNCICAESPRKFTVNLFAYSAGDSARTTVNPVRGLLCPLSLPHELNLRIYVYLVRGLNGKLYIAESPRIFTVQLFNVSAGDSARTTVNLVRGLNGIACTCAESTNCKINGLTFCLAC